MSFNILGVLPKDPIWVACSGGIDSVFAVDFLRQVPGRNLSLAHFNHGTQHSNEAEALVTYLAKHWSLPLIIGNIKEKDAPKGISLEEHWRNERYYFLDSIGGPVITGHTLDDNVETWLWSSCHGNPHVIPYRRNNVIRPFMLTKREDIVSWASRKQMKWVEDPSNLNTSFTRNHIRQYMVPYALKVNPGLHQVVARKIEKAFF